MRDRDIDEVLRRAAGDPPPVDPALLDRIAGTMRSSLEPVQPLPPARVQAAALFLVCAAVALAGAGLLGFHGIRKMSGAEIACIFPVLALCTWAAAVASAREMTPGSMRRKSAGRIQADVVLVLLAVFAALFRDYDVHRFVHAGLVCLTAGVIHAAAAGAGAWLILRRGFAVKPAAAGLTAGTLASLAGVAMLELHCANFEAPHVLVWHTAVVPVSGFAAALAGWVRSRV